MIAFKHYYNGQVLKSISGARHSCMRGMPASTLSSKLCTVQVIEGLKNLSILLNSEMSTFQKL